MSNFKGHRGNVPRVSATASEVFVVLFVSSKSVVFLTKA